MALRKATGIASNETGVRIEDSNAYHCLFHSSEAVVHKASATRGVIMVREMMDGHRPTVWISDRYTAQQGKAAEHQTCLAHLARDVAYVVEVSDDPVPWRLQLWLQTVFASAERVTDFAASTLGAKRRSLVITQASDGRVQAPIVLRMAPKGLLPVMRAVSTTVRMAASPSAAHMER